MCFGRFPAVRALYLFSPVEWIPFTDEMKTAFLYTFVTPPPHAHNITAPTIHLMQHKVMAVTRPIIHIAAQQCLGTTRPSKHYTRSECSWRQERACGCALFLLASVIPTLTMHPIRHVLDDLRWETQFTLRSRGCLGIRVLSPIRTKPPIRAFSLIFTAVSYVALVYC